MPRVTTPAQDLRRGIWSENPVLVQMLGLCPALAVTNTVANSLAMGVATFFVLVCSSLLVSTCRKLIHLIIHPLQRHRGDRTLSFRDIGSFRSHSLSSIRHSGYLGSSPSKRSSAQWLFLCSGASASRNGSRRPRRSFW